MANVIASRFDYDLEPLYLNEDMSNKLFCTFATEDSLESVLEQIQERYKIIYNKINHFNLNFLYYNVYLYYL